MSRIDYTARVIPSRIRVAASVASIAIAGWAAHTDRVPTAAAFAALALWLLWLWVRHADVSRAAAAYAKRDRDRAWALVDGTPLGGRLLVAADRVRYHHLRGRCLLHRDRFAEAAAEAEAAISLGAGADDGPACHTMAAEAYARLGNRDAAERHLELASAAHGNSAIESGIVRIRRILDPGAAHAP
ncbi:MAG: hypothetical protein HMLKMBBP_03823 [Planctomycetes bacterium]|nr:hypothetical protein [Planctomycetota bacterium]